MFEAPAGRTLLHSTISSISTVSLDQPVHLCDAAGFLDFQNPCIRATWAALLPAALVFVLCLSAVPLPHVAPLARKLTSLLKAPFQPFLTLEEAEALQLGASGDGGADGATVLEKDAASLADCYRRVCGPRGDSGLAVARVVQPPQRRQDSMDEGSSVHRRLFVAVYRREARRPAHRHSPVGLGLHLLSPSPRGHVAAC